MACYTAGLRSLTFDEDVGNDKGVRPRLCPYRPFRGEEGSGTRRSVNLSHAGFRAADDEMCTGFRRYTQ